jgi:hypothetical protein
VGGAVEYWHRFYGARVTRQGDDFRVAGFVQRSLGTPLVSYTTRVRYKPPGDLQVTDVTIGNDKRSVDPPAPPEKR